MDSSNKFLQYVLFGAGTMMLSISVWLLTICAIGVVQTALSCVAVLAAW